MKMYWPMIEYSKENGCNDKLWTYDASATYEEAVRVIRRWSEAGYKITRAYIDVYEGDDKERIEVPSAEVIGGESK